MKNEVLHFVETDSEKVASAMIAGYEEKLGRTLYPADPVRMLLQWAAAIDVQARVNINHAAGQNIPRYAQGECLDLLAEMFKGLERLPPAMATVPLQFTLSEARATDIVVPQGTRVTPDHVILFETDAPLTIHIGDTVGTVTAHCTRAGVDGNGFMPGQINKLVDPVSFVKRAENSTTSEGGTVGESDRELYRRMRENPETYSTAGPVGAYEYYAKSASTLVTDVKATSPLPGVVDVRILLKNGGLPGNELLGRIATILSADDVRPLTDKVEVHAATAVPYQISVRYYTQGAMAKSAEEVAAEVASTIERYKQWQCAKMGRDINPSYLVGLLMQTGIKRVEVASPVFTPVGAVSVAVADEVTVVNGGEEGE